MSTAAPPASRARGYDRATIHGEDGTKRSVSRVQYEQIPLTERIRLLLQDRVEFYREGVRVPANEALRVSAG
jgi:hypothetical protein